MYTVGVCQTPVVFVQQYNYMIYQGFFFLLKKDGVSKNNLSQTIHFLVFTSLESRQTRSINFFDTDNIDNSLFYD